MRKYCPNIDQSWEFVNTFVTGLDGGGTLEDFKGSSVGAREVEADSCSWVGFLAGVLVPLQLKFYTPRWAQCSFQQEVGSIFCPIILLKRH